MEEKIYTVIDIFEDFVYLMDVATGMTSVASLMMMPYGVDVHIGDTLVHSMISTAIIG